MASRDEKLAEFVKRLQAAAGANLESVILYGSAARGETHEGFSDLNVFCTMRALGVDELAQLSPAVIWWTSKQKEPPPLFFTAQELRESAGVFAIEFYDMQKSHRVLYGADALAGITVPMNLHRVQVEHELRTLLLKLRMHFLHQAGDAKEVRSILAKSHASVLTLLRHTLIALGDEPPDAPRDVFSQVAALTGADSLAFEPGLEIRESGKSTGDVAAAYGAYLSAIEKVIAALDRQLPKNQWKRAGAAVS
jgi:hypothetical protein